MNVLILSAIKKINLIKAFYECSRSYDCKIIIADNDLSKKNTQINNKFTNLIIKSPKYSNNYVKWLIKTVIKYDINLVVPTNSDEIFFTERLRRIKFKHRLYLTGIPQNKVKFVNDKKRLFFFLKNNKIQKPKLLFLKNKLINEKKFIIKDRYGKKSKGLEILNNFDELLKYKKKGLLNKKIIQEFKRGQEFGLDIVNDFNGNYLGVLVRKKILMQDGETKIAKISKPDKFVSLAKRLSKLVKHKGLIDIDLIKIKKKIFVLDINPRFGGGYILSHKAGANIPSLLMNLVKNKKNTTEYFFKQNFGKIVKIN